MIDRKTLLLVIVVLAVGVLAGRLFPVEKGPAEVGLVSNPLYAGGEGAAFSGTGGQGARHVVVDGGSIQDAVNLAQPGDVIEVHPGVYRETVYIDKDGITLTGVVREGEWPTLEGDGEKNDAILYSGHNITIENFRIAHYKGNGVMGQAGNNFVIRNNLIVDAGVYGIFPQFGTNGLIANNVLTQISDAAIYVGMSDNVDVLHNEVYGNVAGIEIENSRHALVEGNYAWNNTGGILVFITPGLPIKTNYDVVIRDNFVIENNHENFGAPGSLVSNIPPGTGIMVMAADDVVIEDNIIRGNENVGILVTSTDILEATSGDPETDPNSDNVAILSNLMMDNGENPIGELKALMLAQMETRGPDVLDTGGGSGNCILNESRYRVLLLADYSQCDEAAKTSRNIRTMTLSTPAGAGSYAADAVMENIGMRTYYAICSACHAYDIPLIGPSVQEIQTMYEGDPESIAEYIAAPTKVRPDAPEMPPQNYLSADSRRAVAEYVLSLRQ